MSATKKTPEATSIQSLRKVLNIGQKREILEQLTNGETHQTVANKYGVGRSTVTKVWKNKDRIELNHLGSLVDFKKRLRKGRFDTLEIELLKWCFGECKKSLNLSLGLNLEDEETIDDAVTNFLKDKWVIDDNIIRKQAEKIAKELDCEDFECSAKWLGQFKRKFDLSSGRKRRQHNSVNMLQNFSTKESLELLPATTHVIKSNVPPSVELFHLVRKFKMEVLVSALQGKTGTEAELPPSNIVENYNPLNLTDFTFIPNNFNPLSNYTFIPSLDYNMLSGSDSIYSLSSTLR